MHGECSEIDERMQPPIADIRRDLLAEIRTSDFDGCRGAVVAKPFRLEIASNGIRSTRAQLLAAEKGVAGELSGDLLVEDEVRAQWPRVAEVGFDVEILPQRFKPLLIELVAATAEGERKVDGRPGLGHG